MDWFSRKKSAGRRALPVLRVRFLKFDEDMPRLMSAQTDTAGPQKYHHGALGVLEHLDGLAGYEAHGQQPTPLRSACLDAVDHSGLADLKTVQRYEPLRRSAAAAWVDFTKEHLRPRRPR